MKKVLSIMLSLMMVISIIPMSTITTSAATYSGTCGTNVTWSYDDSTYVLTVSGTGEMNDYSSYDRPWESYEDSIKTVVIEDGVTTIGDYAFFHFDSLTSVTIPDSVTSIGWHVFNQCTSLTSVTIPDSVTSIGDYAFQYCTKFTSITIPDSVTSIGDYAFAYCSGLTSVTIGNGVTSIGKYSFKSCTSLTSVTIPDSVTSIGRSAFSSCTSLTSFTVDSNNQYYSSDEYGVLFNKDKTTLVNYPIGNTRTSYTIPDSVTSIGDYAFARCTSLTSVTIPDSVTSIGGSAFEYCRSLTSITIPDSVTSIGSYAFYQCTSLTNVEIGNSVTSIGSSAFDYCDSLTSITIPDSVTSIGYSAFEDCTSLTSVTIPDSVTSIGNFAFYNTAYYNDTSNWENNVLYIGNHLIKAKTSISGAYEIKDGTITIANYAFSSCTSLTSITIPDSVTSIGDDVFENCTSLANVTIPDSVTSIGSFAFSSCTSLTSITIPDSVTSIDFKAFYKCTSLTSITIPDSVTSIGNYAFGYCTSLTSITIPDSVTSIGDGAFDNTAYYNDTSNWENNVLSIGNHLIKADSSISGDYEIKGGTIAIADYAFNYCTNLTSVTISDDVASIGTFAFRHCTGLTSVTIPDSVTSIGFGAFNYCTGLTSIKIGDNVTSIGPCAFNSCTSLKSITIPDGVTLIDYDTFAYCHSLVEITIPDSVTSIGENAFYYCTSLKDVYYSGTEEQWNNIIIDNTDNGNSSLFNAKIHCSGTVSHTHSFTSTPVVTTPTCTEQGYTTYTCECGYSYKADYTDATGHTVIFDEAVEATCTETGLTGGSHCSVCNEVLVVQTEIAALGHSFGEWYEMVEPSYMSDGVEIRVCERCSESETRAIPALVAEKTYNDLENDISITVTEDTYSGDIVVSVTPVYEGDAYQVINDEIGNYDSIVFDIATLIDGEKVQPNGKVLVKMPIPAGYNPEKIEVYYIPNDGSEPEKMEIVIEGNYILFETDHFSNYAVVDTTEKEITFNIQSPSRTTISKKNGIILHASIGENAPDGSYVVWTASNNKFTTSTVDDDSLKIISNKNGYTTFTATLYDADGNVLASDSIEMRSKAGFFDVIASWFRKATVYES